MLSISNFKTLRVSLYDNIWKELHGRLFWKDSSPHLDYLKVNSLEGERLDLKMLMSVSKKICAFDLESEHDGFSCKNLEPTDLRGFLLYKLFCTTEPYFVEVLDPPDAA